MYIKIDENLYAEEVENPINIISIIDLEAQISSLQNQLDTDFVLLEYSDPKLNEVVDNYNSVILKQRRQTEIELLDRQNLLNELMSL
jgi:hypothetical protein